MRIVVCDCSVVYAGRGNTTLDRAVRAIIIKGDGSVGIHNDIGNKAINYMGKGSVLTTTIPEDGHAEEVWRFDARKEYIEITLYSIISDLRTPLDDGQVPLVRDGTEDKLQAWLHAHPAVLGEGLRAGEREFTTSAGSIDLLFEDEHGNIEGFEVKRVAMLASVDQCLRYVRALEEDFAGVKNRLGEDISIRVTLVALDVRPKTALLAQKRGIEHIIVPHNWNSEPDFDRMGEDAGTTS